MLHLPVRVTKTGRIMWEFELTALDMRHCTLQPRPEGRASLTVGAGAAPLTVLAVDSPEGPRLGAGLAPDGIPLPAGALIHAERLIRPADRPDMPMLLARIGPARLLFGTDLPAPGTMMPITRTSRVNHQATPAGRLARGTLIETPHGEVPIEDLEHGDEVLGRDGSARLVIWTGHSRISPLELALRPQLRPLRIGVGALTGGRPGQDLWLAQDQRLVVDDWRAAYLFGEDEILAPAHSLLNGRNVTVECPRAGIDYFGLLTGGENLICANGIWAEALPADGAGLGAAARREIRQLLAAYAPAARPPAPPPLPALPVETALNLAA